MISDTPCLSIPPHHRRQPGDQTWTWTCTKSSLTSSRRMVSSNGRPESTKSPHQSPRTNDTTKAAPTFSSLQSPDLDSPLDYKSLIQKSIPRKPALENPVPTPSVPSEMLLSSHTTRTRYLERCRPACGYSLLTSSFPRLRSPTVVRHQTAYPPSFSFPISQPTADPKILSPTKQHHRPITLDAPPPSPSLQTVPQDPHSPKPIQKAEPPKQNQSPHTQPQHQQPGPETPTPAARNQILVRLITRTTNPDPYARNPRIPPKKDHDATTDNFPEPNLLLVNHVSHFLNPRARYCL